VYDAVVKRGGEETSRNDDYIAAFKKNVLFEPFTLHIVTVVEVCGT